jgi:transposase
LKSEIAPLFAVLLCVNQQLAWVDGCLERLAKSDETVARLRAALSVGPVTAAAFSSTIDDVERFRNAHQVEAYLGLVPSEKSSGERQQRGHITKAGNTRMRRLLVQVAVSILRLRSPRTQELRDWASRFARRRGKRIATVALARRVAGVLYTMMRDGTCCAAAQPKAVQKAA